MLQEQGAWNTLVWISTLVMMANYLNELGLVPWFATTMGGMVEGIGWVPALAALVLAFFSNLFAGLSHYGTGPAPVFFGSGYVELGAWWQLGALISVINIIIWTVIGGLWWRVIGLW